MDLLSTCEIVSEPALEFYCSSKNFENRTNCHSARVPYAKMRAVVLAILYRVMRRWNQTGQKFSGEPDIARDFLLHHQDLLWVLVFLAYSETCRRIVVCLYTSGQAILWSLISVIVTGVAFTFKLAFTAADSPELLGRSSILRPVGDILYSVSLITHARLVFFGIAAIVSFSGYMNLKRRRSPVKRGNQKPYFN